MYSGTTLTTVSGRVMGAHQKIDRVARKHLDPMLARPAQFPPSKLILHFEGRDGPDGVKRKSPADEPEHFIDPLNPHDRQLVSLIKDGYGNLVQALKSRDEVKAAFEAAWLSHALVDGLTPAHHYPYEQELAQLRGDSRESRLTLKKKLIIPGENIHKQIANNWKMWGAKGLMSTHGYFELGVAAVLASTPLEHAVLEQAEIELARRKGLGEYFLEQAKAIATLKMYDQFYASGWTTRLARESRQELLPRMVKLVTLAWYLAAHDGVDHKV